MKKLLVLVLPLVIAGVSLSVTNSAYAAGDVDVQLPGHDLEGLRGGLCTAVDESALR